MGAKGYAAGWAGRTHVESMFAIKNDWSPEMIERYYVEYAASDPWTQAMMRLPPTGQFHALGDHVSEQSFENSALFNDLLREGGDDTFHAAGNMFALPSGGAGGLTFYRGKGQAGFAASSLDELNAAGGDLQRLLILKASLHADRIAIASWQDMIDRLLTPVIVLNTGRGIVAANLAAQDILSLGRGLCMRGGKLTAVLPEKQAELETACRSALNAPIDQVATFSLRCGEIARHFTLMCAPNPGGGRRIILLGDQPESLGVGIHALLRCRYRLSPAEADLMVHLANGLSTSDIAERRRVTVDTLRTQYRAAMAKMDCRSLIQAIITVRRMPILDDSENRSRP